MEEEHPVLTTPSQKDTRSAKPSSSQPIQPRDIEESKRGEKRKEISVLTSKFNQARTYQKFSSSAVKLDKMPDYANELIRQKKAEFGELVYEREEFEVADCVTLGPL